MNIEEKKEIASMLMVRAELSGRSLSPQAIGMMIEDLEDLDADEVKNILKNWGKKEIGFPFPALVREKITPEISSRDDAQDIANVVIACVSRHGYTNPSRAREEIGELGWATITRMGGWKHLCETLTSDNEGIFRAQIRDYAETVSKKAQRGSLDQMPSLPINDEIKKLTSGIKFLEVEND